MTRSSLDPRTPVIVGVGQSLRKPNVADLDGIAEPVDVIADVLRATGVPDALLRRADSVRIVDFLSWQYVNAAALVAERLGASPRETVRSAVGGNSPQMLVNDTAQAIQRGELDVVLIAGAEAVYTRSLARKADVSLKWTTRDDEAAAGRPEPRIIGIDKPGTSDTEQARGLFLPTNIYPIFESAVRAANGRTLAEHTAVIAGLWSRFSAVAAKNPYAWQPEFLTPEQIATPSPENRMVGFPYTKVMNANIQTDQAAGLVMCSIEAAEKAGIPRDRWVFPWSGADAHDHWYISNRWSLADSPGMEENGRAALGLAGVGIDEVAHVDLYSCFPVAVEVGAASLGIGLDEPDRPLTMTGGLTFGGGPGNNYVTHGIASLYAGLVADPGSIGIATANGWYHTKHSIGVYSTDPPRTGSHRWESPQAAVDGRPSRVAVEVADGYEGPATVEAYTVTHERDGSPALGIVAALLPDGRRAWSNNRDPLLLAELCRTEHIGRPAILAADGSIDLP